ncbi:hypothetical protein L1765_14065 [Microaerobacter geothermalis]|uniref:hypothetical protein n=1 Tax=Microaerobacter geothermalis TaxID=674972 RepID=UPI001F310B3F|nr:hypothetical protein [Microaerobacter geothermalis]MCF6095085.1 hypothetical protein [Microaerobacter geothermalis]
MVESGLRRLIKLKAALYSGGSTARFLRMAAEEYVGTLPDKACVDCGSSSKVIHQLETLTCTVGDKIHTVKVKGVPMYQCEK